MYERWWILRIVYFVNISRDRMELQKMRAEINYIWNTHPSRAFAHKVTIFQQTTFQRYVLSWRVYVYVYNLSMLVLFTIHSANSIRNKMTQTVSVSNWRIRYLQAREQWGNSRSTQTLFVSGSSIKRKKFGWLKGLFLKYLIRHPFIFIQFSRIRWGQNVDFFRRTHHFNTL